MSPAAKNSQSCSSASPDPRTVKPKREGHLRIRLRCTQDSIDEGWACRVNGQCDLFPDMDLAQVKVLRLAPDFRLFRTMQRQPPGKPDHILTWGETKGTGIVVWSEFAAKARRSGPDAAQCTNRTGLVTVPNKRNIGHGLRTRILGSIRKSCHKPSQRLQALGFTSMTHMKNSCRETIWQVGTERRSPRLSSHHLKA